MSIEDVAHNTPEKIFKLQVDINKGLDVEALLKAAVNLGLDEYKSQVVFLFKHLYDLFIERDADLIEINPLTLLKDGSIVAADAKITIDVGGSANSEQMTAAIELLDSDPEVKSIFINIFGGILKCDSLA